MAAIGRPALTPTGWTVAAGAGGALLMGWALGYPALGIIGIALVVGLVLGGLSTLPTPAISVMRAIEPSRVERGSPALGLVSVRNIGARRSSPCLAVEPVINETLGETRHEGPRSVQVMIPSLRSRRSAAVSYELPTLQRGVLQIGPLAIVRRDPFGLWQARRPVGDTVTLLVQPRVLNIDPRRGGRARHIDGPVSDTAPRGTQTFHSLREYTPGDDIRRVHWRSSARTGTLMVREHVDTSLPSTVVVLDTRAERYSAEAFEEAVDVAASVVAASLARGFPVRLITTSGATFLARRGQRGQDLQDFLASVLPEADASFGKAIVEVLRGREHDAITVVGSEIDAADLAEITTITQRFASPSLVTLRPSRPGLNAMWSRGLHLDAPTAIAALVRWQTTVTSRDPEAAMS